MKIEFGMYVLPLLLWLGLVYTDTVEAVAKRLIDASQESISELEWRKEFVLHAAFYGTVIAALLGFAHDSIITKLIAALWFAVGLWYSRQLTALISTREEHEDKEHRRKVAGMVRSVVRSELIAFKKTSGKTLN